MSGIVVNGKRIAKLIMVTGENNNKFYNMAENDNGTFTATWGRVDVTSQSQSYPSSQWNKKYNEKIKKGYEDKTSVFLEVEEIKAENDTDEVVYDNTPKEVISFITTLQAYANDTIKANYKVSANQVTQVQLDEAQKFIDELVAYTKVRPFSFSEFNDILLNIYKTIPRAMGNVKNYLLSASTKKDKMEALIEAEQDLLDTMRGQVQTVAKTKKKTKTSKDKSLEEMFGLVMEPATADDIKMIKDLLGPNKNQFVKAFRVINKSTEERAKEWYDKAAKKYKANKDWADNKLFWHGSRNENWWSILQNGLVLRPAKAIISGKMFGYGTYFADKAQKSINYTSLRGSYWAHGSSERAYMGLYEVYLGRVKKITRHQSSHCNLEYTSITKEGYDSVFAQGGFDLINNEFIVYHEHQTTIRFIVEIKN